MKRHGFAALAVFGFGAMVMAYGCSLNPWAGISYDEAGEILGVPEQSTSSSSTNGGMSGAAGTGGNGGMAGAGGLAGQGGSAGAGGAVCAGGCVCMPDNDECTLDSTEECPNGDITKCTHSINPGAPCSAGKDFVCNLEGKCDGDCLVCPDDPACTARCNGQMCPDDAGCKSGYCEQGVCCNAECIGPCKSCNREGTVGSCQRLPLGMQVPGCTGSNACSSTGECVIGAGAPLGGGCNGASSCMSNWCRAAGCVSQVGEPCAEDLECASKRCDPVSHLCKPCSGMGSVPCAPGLSCLPGGFCQSLPGEPAVANADCTKGTVLRYMCVLPQSSPCSAHEECESRNCNGGFCSAPCTKDADCVAGTTCDGSWGQCKLPKGARCIPGTAQATSCQSGKCSGFPPRCE